MSDKTPVYIGGPPRHSEYVTTREGALPFEIAKATDSYEKFTVQLLAACSADYSITRPCKAFVKHDKQEKATIQDQLEACRRRAEVDAAKQIQIAKTDPQSLPAQAVEQANKDIYTQHTQDIATGKKVPKTKRRLSPEQVFKVDKKDFKRTSKKGMDFAQYAYNWLLLDLYPYYQDVCKNNPNYDVYLVEDNSSVHTKAR